MVEARTGQDARTRASRPEVDWLLVDASRFDGRKGSLQRLWKMRDCAMYANVLKDTGVCEVWTSRDRDWTRVHLLGDSVPYEVRSVGRGYPFIGLQPLYERLKGLALPLMVKQ